MSHIVCGVDFSDASQRATHVAAALAKKLSATLHWVHALGDWYAEDFAGGQANLAEITRQALQDRVSELETGTKPSQFHVEFGRPVDALMRVASAVQAHCVIVGATGRGEAVGRAGRTADRLSQESPTPVLVVRSEAPFLAWLEQKKPLRVLVGLSFEQASEAAWAWSDTLAQAAPIERVGAHLYWPPQEFHRLGLSGARSYVDADPEVEASLRRELEVSFPARGVPSRFRLSPSLGRPADHLLMMAKEEKADVVIVGSHQRGAVQRLWEGSVSRQVVHDPHYSVVCVPKGGYAGARTAREVRNVLVATDFSPSGNAAVAAAFVHCLADAKVHIAHVMGRDERREDVMTKLRATLPERRVVGNRTVDFLVLEATNVAEGIAQAAERVGADLICLGAPDRRTVPVVTPTPTGVLFHSNRPVLLVRAPAA
ncbi:MAG: universal stress protein [Myxococcaceae bacterium]